MASEIRYCPDNRIIYVTHRGQVDHDDRMRLKTFIEQLGVGNKRMLVDVREVKSFVVSEEAQAFYRAIEDSGLYFRKIALVHDPRFNPYVVMASAGVIEGFNIEDFTTIEAAERWLLSR
ncbi:STAS/SEC14 domain-containing protein [Motiliproteus sediminis]|uniref:STAS/SEC14 domain-containing protein n=1 Tax=Motiliproteus sediminis TaxID=1468178 RepID=UPI001AEFEEFE|nr:STAS/SEC14 domain-containing protein [Motiliproteus sediminis]